MLAPSDAPGSMQALEVAGLDKPEPKGWWQWVTARLNGSSTASYKPLEEDAGPSDRVSPEGAKAHRLIFVSSSCTGRMTQPLQKTWANRPQDRLRGGLWAAHIQNVESPSHIWGQTLSSLNPDMTSQ